MEPKHEPATGFTSQDREMLTAVYRGMYGDRQNDQPGMVTIVSEHSKWIASANRKIWFLSGAAAAVAYAFSRAMDYLTDKHH